MIGNSRLSRRERQIMEILYPRGEASASEVQAALPDPPSYSATRTLLRILEEKGHVTHRQEGVKYIYAPVNSRSQAARSALTQVIQTFFGGSAEQAVATLVSDEDARLSSEQLERLETLIAQAREKGR